MQLRKVIYIFAPRLHAPWGHGTPIDCLFYGFILLGISLMALFCPTFRKKIENSIGLVVLISNWRLPAEKYKKNARQSLETADRCKIINL